METIYAKLGPDKMQELIDFFYDEVFQSEKIGHLFQHSDKVLVKDKQLRFLSQFLGGPMLYTDKYGSPMMRKRHFPHAITVEAKDEWLRLMKLSIWKLDLDEDMKFALYNCFPKLAAHMVNT